MTQIVYTMYHHFFSICALIPALFGFVLCISFLFSRKKTKASLIIGLTLLSMSFFYGGYFAATIIYHPFSAYHRWVTFSSSSVCFILFSCFFFYYPSEKNVKAGKAVFAVLITVFLLFFAGYAINSMTSASIVFNFSSHYYDFAPSLFEKAASFMTLFFLLTVPVSGLWRAAVTREHRGSIISIAVLAFLAFLLPAVFNILSRTGDISRGTYQISQDLSTLFGFFTITIIYINTTKDRTMLLTRIIIITFATLLLTYQGISYFILNDQEQFYSDIRQRDGRLYLTEHRVPEGMIYHAIISPDGIRSFDTNLQLSAPALPSPDPKSAQGRVKDPVFITGRSGLNYIAYHYSDSSGILHEFGYSYLDYRKFLHSSSRVLVITILAITAIILLGFRIFFHQSLTVPLNNLKSGIEAVRKGDRGVRLPVIVEDELGMITDSFNIMVKKLDSQESELNNYARNLSRMVDERTNELSRSLQDLKSAQSKLIESEKLASLGGLVAGVAHEINTPIGICVTSSSFLLAETSRILLHFSNNNLIKSDLQKYLFNAAESSTMLLSNLYAASDMILSFKKIAVDQTHEEIRTFNVSEYISDIIVSLRPALKKKGHRIDSSCPDDLHASSYPGALYQIMTNLIMNSIMHGFENMKEGTISVSIAQEKEMLVIDYRDNGSGMNNEQLSRIYEPFYTTKRGKGGSGLGMNIVYNIITQKLKGTISAESKQGEGVRFIIEFPLHTPA